jgi:hypothetical protein
MKLKFIEPDVIMGAVLALIILGVGVFASFTVYANIPSTVPQCNTARDGNGTLYDATYLETNATLRWIPTPNALNNTGVCVLYAEGSAGTSGGFDAMYILQNAGSCNGTFMANSTYRVPAGIYHTRNNTLYLHYTTTGAVTSALSNSTYTAIINVSTTSTTVFNIIGVVLILAAIMMIVTLIYSYIRPRM